jgi:hypothetical protein
MVVAGRGAFEAWSGTVTLHRFPAFSPAGGCIVPGHRDLPWPWPDDPKTSFKAWLAATPAMTIMEPRATYWQIMAIRSLPQFLDIA